MCVAQNMDSNIKLMNLCWLWSYQETVTYQLSCFQHWGKVLVATQWYINRELKS